MKKLLQELLRVECECVESGNFEKCERVWEEVVQEHGSPPVLLLARNHFRLRNLPYLEVRRPGVILGSINDDAYPNFHSIGLLKVADVVSLTTQEIEPHEKDRLRYSWVNDSFPSICNRLPKGFRPSLFWDSQAAHRHLQPRGLQDAPCPTAAGLCHVFMTHACNSLADLFDFVCPVGEAFLPSFEQSGRAQALSLPFGLNWASFHESFFKESDKTRNIDLSVLFSPSDDPAYHGNRNEVLRLAERFRRKWSKKYRVEIASGLEVDEYHDLLLRSRLSVNVVGLNGPYNYRTCEIINAGALLLQLDSSLNAIPSNDEEVFVEGEHFARFRLDDFEEVVLRHLQDRAKLEAMALSAKRLLEQEYSYENLYARLIRETADRWKGPERGIDSREGDFLASSVLWHQVQHTELMCLGAGVLIQSLDRTDSTAFHANLLAILPEVMQVMGATGLANMLRQFLPSVADKIETGQLNVIAATIFGHNLEHPAIVWNFLAVSCEGGWLPREQLLECAQTNFTNYEWADFDRRNWLLRQQTCPNWVTQEQCLKVRMKSLIVPLLNNKEGGAGEWRIHRDYLLELLAMPAASQS